MHRPQPRLDTLVLHVVHLACSTFFLNRAQQARPTVYDLTRHGLGPVGQGDAAWRA